MKLVVFLLPLLILPSLLGSETHVCDTGFALSGYAFNIPGSKMSLANVTFIHAYNCSNLQTCLDECCAGKYGLCSIAMFKNEFTQINCIHFYCRPIHQCKFFSSTVVDSYAFPATTFRLNTDDEKNKLSSAEIAPKLLQQFYNVKSQARSITPKKGTEKIGRKGALQAVVNIDDLTLIDGNVTMVPDKKLESPKPRFPSSESNLSVIKPRKGVDADVYNFGNTGSKIKPRKGVGPFIAPTPATVIRSKNHFSSNEISQSAVWNSKFNFPNESEIVFYVTKRF